MIDRFSRSDVPAFMRLASDEGWITTERELVFLMECFPEGCFSFRDSSRAIGFITSVRYDKSGWIGNLVVHREMRGRGMGSALMGKALFALLRAGVETVWLTASDSGKPLYAKIGFAGIDSIIRWKGRGGGDPPVTSRPIKVEDALALDAWAWGDRRCSLVRGLHGRAEVIGTGEAFLFIQDHGAFMQLGPWTCRNRNDAPKLLDLALSMCGEGRETVLDVPEGNAAACKLLESRGFTEKGRTALMFFGVKPFFRPDSLYALASMGSKG